MAKKGACGISMTSDGMKRCSERYSEGKCKACGGEGRPTCPYRGEASKKLLKRNNTENVAAMAGG